MKITLLVIMLLLCPAIQAATLQGSIYNADLELEQEVLVELSTIPAQRYLSRDGQYSFEIPAGTYTLTARTEFNAVTETVTIVDEGRFVVDLFLLPDLTEESSLFSETQQELIIENIFDRTSIWKYLAAAIIVLVLLARFIKLRRRYGSLSQFRAKVREESSKTVDNNPQYLDQVLEIIKKHEGRIHQKKLRQELLYLSEAKVSLIVSELEHKGLVEKFKKGRGNIIILK